MGTEKIEVSKIEVQVKRQLLIEEVEGGLFFVSMLHDGKPNGRKAATSGAALLKNVSESFNLQKQKRGPRKAKAEKTAAKAE